MNCEYDMNIEAMAEKEYQQSLNERQEYYLSIVSDFDD